MRSKCNVFFVWLKDIVNGHPLSSTTALTISPDDDDMIDITPTDHPAYAHQRGGAAASGQQAANTSGGDPHHQYERPSSPQHNAFAPPLNEHDANVLFYGGNYGKLYNL